MAERQRVSWADADRPENFEFTPHRLGWAKWYRGQTRVVSLKSLDKAAVRAAWETLKAKIDAKLDGVTFAPMASTTSLLLGADRFFKYLDGCVAKSFPKAMSYVTADDYRRVITEFVGSVGPGRDLGDLSQDDFATYIAAYASNAPTTVYRVVSYIKAFMRFCVDEGLLAAEPRYGRMFVKPSEQDRRDVRIGVQKSMDPDAVRLLFDHARADERCWIILGLCGAMDNADIGALTWDVIDREAGLIDYRRRKKGKVRRVIPMPPELWLLLEQYNRPEPADPAHADRVFLTPEGLPLQRRKISDNGKPSTIDYVNMRWSRLMVKANLRPPMPRRRNAADRDTPKRTKRKGSSGGHGFRALRTTFPNLAPPGYRDEVEIVMGHAHGAVLLDNYLERVGLVRLRELVDSVFIQLSANVPTSGQGHPAPPRAWVRHEGQPAYR